MYFFQLGRAGFDDAEAYSAYIASRPNPARGLRCEPQPRSRQRRRALRLRAALVLRHFRHRRGGTARVLGGIRASPSVMLVFALAAELFGAETALIAAALWAFNPMALIVARWARMYSMFIALTLGSLLAMRKVQQRPNALRVATFGVVRRGDALHASGRRADARRRGGAARARSMARAARLRRMPGHRDRADPLRADSADRARADTCLGVGTSFRLDRECAPDAARHQDRRIVGRRGDRTKLVFGPAMPFDHAGANPRDDSEPMRWCAIWSILPLLALMVGSLVLHPMFQIRYIAPVTAGFAILAAAALNFAGARIRNLAAVAIASAFLIVAILFQLYHRPFELWRRIARAVERRQFALASGVLRGRLRHGHQAGRRARIRIPRSRSCPTATCAFRSTTTSAGPIRGAR